METTTFGKYAESRSNRTGIMRIYHYGTNDVNNVVYYVMNPAMAQSQNLHLAGQQQHLLQMQMQGGIGYMPNNLIPNLHQPTINASHLHHQQKFIQATGNSFTSPPVSVPSAGSSTLNKALNGATAFGQLTSSSEATLASGKEKETTENLTFSSGAEDITESLGPVEKAVFNQALYNHTKTTIPTLKKCEECNVIFNSQAQAQMHYKGKKHARAMYLKRKSDSSAKCLLTGPAKAFPSENGDAEKYMMESTVSSPPIDSISPQSDVSPTIEKPEVNDNIPTSSPIPVCRIRYNNPSLAKHSIVKDAVLDKCDTVIQTEQTKTNCDSPEDENETSIVADELVEATENTCDNEQIKVKQETDENLTNTNEDDKTDETMTTAQENDKNDSVATSPGSDMKPVREVVLPDPLPSYIKRVERPTVLKESLHCNVCDIYVNSENQMKQHVNSLRHKNIQQGIPTPPKPVRDDKPKTKAEQFKCEVCGVTLNSDIQLSQHLQSQRHKNMLEGKPPKPRWTPYDKTQSNIAQLRAAAQLQLPFKTLAPGILPTIPGISLAGGHALGSFLPQAIPQTHFSPFIATSGGLYDPREVVYLSNSAGFPAAHQANNISLNLQTGRELAPLITSAPGVDWSTTQCQLKQ